MRGPTKKLRFAPLAALLTPIVVLTCPGSEPDSARAKVLVEELAHPDFATRERAQLRLREMGRAAEAALKKVLDSPDIEQRLRARELTRELARRDLWEPSRIRLAARDTLATDLFQAIAAQSGNPINWGRSPKSFTQKLDVAFDGATYWAAVDDIARRARIVPRVYDDPNRGGLVLTHGDPGIAPVSLQGPLRLTLLTARRATTRALHFGDGGVDEQDTLELSSSLFWEQKLALCRYSGRPRIVEAKTDAGEDLALEKPTSAGIMHLTRRQRQLVFSSQLRAPARPAKRWTKLAFQWELTAAGLFETLELALRESVRHAENGGYELEIIDARELDDRAEIVVQWSRPIPYDRMNLTDMVDEYLEIVDAEGRTLPFNPHQVLGGRESVRYVVHVLKKDGTPATVRFHVAMLKSERTVRFEFRDVPMPVSSVDP